MLFTIPEIRQWVRNLKYYNKFPIHRQKLLTTIRRATHLENLLNKTKQLLKATLGHQWPDVVLKKILNKFT